MSTSSPHSLTPMVLPTHPLQIAGAGAETDKKRLKLPLRERWVLLVLALLIILNRGFSSIAIPPGIPIAELTLVVYLLLVNWPVLLPRLLRDIPFIPYAAWWGLGIASCLYYSRIYGFWAFRDAGFVLDSLFLFVGYAMGRSELHVLTIFRWLRPILIIGGIYALTFPIGGILSSLLSASGAHGQASPILGQYLNSVLLLVGGAISVYTHPPKRVLFRQLAPLYFTLAIAVVALAYQGRGNYILILGAGIALSIFFPRESRRFWLAPVAFLLILVFIDASGIEISGRLGKISLNFVIEHVLSLSGKATGEGAEGAANGIVQRYGWWHSVIAQWLASATTFIFGTGFGRPLIDFRDPDGNPVRDPHNSYLSILGRMGVIGSVAWFWINAHLFYKWQRAFRILTRQKKMEMRSYFIVCLFFFFACLQGAVGEPVFEFPFNTIPYYFLAGVCIRYSGLLVDNQRAARRSLRE